MITVTKNLFIVLLVNLPNIKQKTIIKNCILGMIDNFVIPPI